MNLSTTSKTIPVQVRICGITMEVIGAIGITWSLLVLFTLWRHNHLKSNVTYVPICSLTAATCGQLFLVVLHLAPDLLDRPVSGVNKTLGNFMFFPFWYAVLSSVWLMAANRCAVACNVPRARKFFTRRFMLAASGFGWTLGVVIGSAAYVEGVLEDWLEWDDDRPPSPPDSSVESQRNCTGTDCAIPASSLNVARGRFYTFSWLLHSNRSDVLTITQIVDCLTLAIVAVCYAFVIYRLKFRGGEIAEQLNGQHHQQQQQQIVPTNNQPFVIARRLPSIARSPTTTAAAVARGTKMQNVGPFRSISTVVAAPSSPSRSVQQQQQHQDGVHTATAGGQVVDVSTLWFITLQFGLLSLSVGLFAIFILLGNLRVHSFELLLAMELLYSLTSLLNILLVSMTSRKLQSQLIAMLTAPARVLLIRPCVNAHKRFVRGHVVGQGQKQQLQGPSGGGACSSDRIKKIRHKPPMVIISRAENTM